MFHTFELNNTNIKYDETNDAKTFPFHGAFDRTPNDRENYLGRLNL